MDCTVAFHIALALLEDDWSAVSAKERALIEQWRLSNELFGGWFSAPNPNEGIAVCDITGHLFTCMDIEFNFDYSESSTCPLAIEAQVVGFDFPADHEFFTKEKRHAHRG